MGLIDGISPSTTIALDTNIFVYAYQKSKPTPTAQDAIALLDKIKEVGIKCFISVLVFEEFLVQIYKRKLEKDINSYENFLTIGGLVTVTDINRQIARVAAKLRAQYPSLRTPDALHLACAIEAGAKIFITTDKRLPRKIGKLKIEVLSADS